METFELKYFLKVAKTQNIHKASKLLAISPSAVSKAITRLENELESKLFEKVGRNIKITEVGLNLVKDASEMLAMEKRIVESYNKDKESISLRLVGPELPLAKWSSIIASKVSQKYTDLQLSIEHVDNDTALNLLSDYTADLAIIASTKKLSGKMYKKLETIKFKTFASKDHSLSSFRGKIPIERILEEKFIITDLTYLIDKTSKSSMDGWRDDKLKRKYTIQTKSLKCLESFLENGLAVSHLPEYYGKSLGLKALNISGCPYECHQDIYIARSKYSLDSVWSLI